MAANFLLPLQKGTEYSMPGLYAPATVRFVGIDPQSPYGKQVMQYYEGLIRQFQATNAQNYLLSTAPFMHKQMIVNPEITLTYDNIQGKEIITATITPPPGAKAKPPVEEAFTPPGFKVPEPEFLCLLILYGGNKVAAVPMGSLSRRAFAPAYTKELTKSSWNYGISAQYKFSEDYAGAHLSPFKFTKTTITSTNTFVLANPSALSKGVVTPCDNTYPVMSGRGTRVYLPSATAEVDGNSFIITEDYTESLTDQYGQRVDPLSIAPDGTYCFYPKVSQEYMYANFRLDAQEAFRLTPEMDSRLSDISNQTITVAIYFEWKSGSITPRYSVATPSYSDAGLNTSMDLDFPVPMANAGGAGVKKLKFTATSVLYVDSEDNRDHFDCEIAGYTFSGSSANTGGTGYNQVWLCPFPPGVDGKEFTMSARAPDYTNTTTRSPYGDFPGLVYGSLHISNGTHTIQAFSTTDSNGSGSSPMSYYLDGVDVTSELCNALQIDRYAVDTMVMDVPLKDIKEFV